MQTVFIAGATGYLGQYLIRAYKRRNWRVVALARSGAAAQAKPAQPDRWVIAEATQSSALGDALPGVDVVVSALGMTKQKDGLSPWNVDYQANMNLLNAALDAGVSRFAYVHVLNAGQMLDVPLVAAKQAFVDKLISAPISHAIIEPTGYFSDMADVLKMAKRGRVWLFGDGQLRLNPIHGEDLAAAIAEAASVEGEILQIGGPDILTQREIAELAFKALGKPPKIAHLPDLARRIARRLVKWFAPQRVAGPALFFLTAIGQDMAGPSRGRRRLADFFAEKGANDP